MATLAPAQESVDVRVEDFLNDKLQTKADLSTLPELLKEVQQQQNVLQVQLDEAESLLEKNKEILRKHATTTAGRVREFQRQQSDIDHRLQAVTASEDSSEAATIFQQTLEKIQRLEIARGYISLLETVEKLNAEATVAAKRSPRSAIASYSKLKELATSLHTLQVAAEGAAPHLIDHVDKLTHSLFDTLDAKLSADLEAVLKEIGWPNEDAKLPASKQKSWESSIEALLELQYQDLLAWKNTTRDSMTFPVLLPLSVLAKPLQLRFRYHFEGDKPTNRLDKPEYFLSHILNLISSYDDFLSAHLQPILIQRFAGTPLATNLLCVDSNAAYITSLLPMLRHKIDGYMNQVSSHPQLFSHFIHELINFDSTLRDDWQYSGISSDGTWQGLTWEALVKKEWFGSWLKIEKDFALSRYHEILQSKDAWEIDYDSVDPQMTKITKSAMRVKDLLETITSLYRPLPSFQQRIQFLIDVQADILDQFHGRLSDALEAYYVTTTTLGRAVQGISKEEQAALAGNGGLERLCRIYGSCEFLEKSMADWSDDIVFVELWQELRKRVKSNSGQKIAGQMGVEEVATRTSSSVTSDEEGGGLFDTTSANYHRLRQRTEGLIIDFVVSKMTEALRPYSRVSGWSSLSSDNTSTTPELDSALRQLSSHLDFLSSALSSASLKRISRRVAAAIDQYIWDSILVRSSFSASGVEQLSNDARAIWATFGTHTGKAQARLAMAKLRDGVKLLGLPLDVTDDSGWLDLQAVEAQLFKGNEEAKAVLSEIQVGLSLAEARSLISRRVELSR